MNEIRLSKIKCATEYWSSIKFNVKMTKAIYPLLCLWIDHIGKKANARKIILLILVQFVNGIKRSLEKIGDVCPNSIHF